jgi:hypothetical protein
MSLIGMVALITAGCDGSADPASTTNPISSCLSTGVGCPPATDTATGTNTGTLTVATVTDSNTGTTTGTDTTPVSTVPAWCNEQAYTSSKIGTPINMIGLWIATCDGVVWDIYIKNAWSDGSVKGWGFKDTDAYAAPGGFPVPSSANYVGVMADNCVYLIPTPLASSTDQSAPPITGSTASASGGVSGGNCTMAYSGGSGAWAHESD